jgi:hypothetical protein
MLRNGAGHVPVNQYALIVAVTPTCCSARCHEMDGSHPADQAGWGRGVASAAAPSGLYNDRRNLVEGQAVPPASCGASRTSFREALSQAMEHMTAQKIIDWFHHARMCVNHC